MEKEGKLCLVLTKTPQCSYNVYFLHAKYDSCQKIYNKYNIPFIWFSCYLTSFVRITETGLFPPSVFLTIFKCLCFSCFSQTFSVFSCSVSSWTPVVCLHYSSVFLSSLFKTICDSSCLTVVHITLNHFFCPSLSGRL